MRPAASAPAQNHSGNCDIIGLKPRALFSISKWPRPRTVTMISRRFRRSEEHTSELQSLMRISYAVFCLKKKNNNHIKQPDLHNHLQYTPLPHMHNTK